MHEGSKCSKGTKSSKSSASTPSPARSSQNTTGLFLLCRENPDRPGFGLSEFESGYDQGEPVYSELTPVEAETLVTDISTTLGTFASVGAGVAGLFDQTKALSAGLGLAGGALGVFTHFFGKSETDITQALIKSEFEKTNREIAKLARQVSQGFADIRKDLADNELDDLMGYLQAIETAYQDMQEAVSSNATEEVRNIYAEEYRAACNRPHFTPDDIFRQFYGFACGDEGVERKCTASNGVATGKCAYGVKKRQFILGK